MNRVLGWVASIQPRTIDGLMRVHASMQGNALLVATRLNLTDDPRVQQLAPAAAPPSTSR